MSTWRGTSPRRSDSCSCHLAIDLGGLHESKTGEVYLDQRRADLEIVPGNVYELHLFFAERHVITSDFSIETTIADPGRCH